MNPSPAMRWISFALGSVRVHSALVWVLIALVALSGCLDSRGCLSCPPPPPPPAPLVASNPVPTTPLTNSASVLTRLASADGDVVYVSLLPGTVPTGGLAVIRNERTGREAQAAMADGGFDPVVFEAAVGDTLRVEVQVEGGGFAPAMRLAVAAARRPVVVRTNPPPRKRDVPLNTSIVFVFSEPIDAGSGSSVRVLQNGSPVRGSVVFSADGLRAQFQPDQILAPSTSYVLSVTSDLVDLSGDRIERSVTSEFTTGTTTIAASVVTDPVALIINPFTGTRRTFEMQGILDANGQVSGTFRIFYPENGLLVAGHVTCFTIVGGNAAWLGGIIDSSSDGPDSNEAVWRVVDNSAAAPTVSDQLSLMAQVSGPGGAQKWCDGTPSIFPDLDEEAVLYDVQGGNIAINPSGAPPPPPPPPPPPLPPDPSRLSQVASFTPYMAILAMNIDGTDLRTVTTGPNDGNPAWSPDARELAFHSDRTQQRDWDIYVVNWDGSGLQHLTSGPDTDLDPDWSPDGSKIAFSRNGSIHVMNANGSGVTRLSFECCNAHARWSPDGSRLVFASARTGVQAIYVMNADGSGVVQLTNEGARDYSPTWSPDGSRIAFARQTNGPDQGLYIMSPDGSGLTQLTLGVNGGGSWSHDGTRLVYELFGMNLINADGTAIQRIGQGFNPAWSPIGIVPTAPQPFRSIEKVSGDGQSGVVGDTLAEPLRVRVIDDGGAPQPGVTVRWNVWGPGAGIGVKIKPQQAITDSDGYATVLVKLSDTAGAIRMRAAVVDGTARRGEVVFTATATLGP